MSVTTAAFQSLYHEVQNLRHRVHFLERTFMTTQAEIDALAAAVMQVATDLDTDKVAIQAQLDALAGANPALDLTALKAAVAPLDDKVNTLRALRPSAPPSAGTGASSPPTPPGAGASAPEPPAAPAA